MNYGNGVTRCIERLLSYVSNSSAIRQKDVRRITHPHITISTNRINMGLLMACTITAFLLAVLVILFAVTERDMEGY